MTSPIFRGRLAGNGIGGGGRGVSGFYSPVCFASSRSGIGFGPIVIILPKIG